MLFSECTVRAALGDVFRVYGEGGPYVMCSECKVREGLRLGDQSVR